MWTSPFPVQAPLRGYGDSAMLPPQAVPPAPSGGAMVPTLLGAAVGAGAGFLFAPNRRGVGLALGALAGAAGVFLVKKYAIPGGAKPGQYISYESTPGMPAGAQMPGAAFPGAPPEPPPPPASGGDGGRTMSTISASNLFNPAPPAATSPPPPAPSKPISPALLAAARIIAPNAALLSGSPRTLSTIASLVGGSAPPPAPPPPTTGTLPGGGGLSFRF